MMTLEQLLKTRQARPEDALQLFDALPPAMLELMTGKWKGYEIKTGHRIDDLLDLSGWYGKLFLSPEEVHPLLFYNGRKTGLFAVNPLLIPLNWPIPKIRALGALRVILRPFVATRSSKARLRMIEYRGKTTGTMVYDHKAIMDHFAKIDDNTLLGVMDLKGDGEYPYFFVLERDETAYPLNVKMT